MSNNQKQNNSQENSQQENSQPKTNPEPAPNKIPPPTQGKYLRFDGSEYIDENNRAEF